jgi:hypothetical protein
MKAFFGPACLSLTMLAVSLAAPAQQKGAGKSVNANDLSLEVAALQTLHDLELTPAQLTALSKLARESAPKGEQRQPAKASAEFVTALTGYHGALANGDDNRIADAREKFDTLMLKEQAELDNGINVTEGALGNAADALKILNVRQVGIFLGTLEMTDPAELLIAALEQVRAVKNGKDVEDEIAAVAEEVVWLVNGYSDEADKTQAKATAVLQKAAKLKTDAVFAGQRKALEKAAREAVGTPDSMEVISHIAEHGMADVLSNPRLEAAIQGRIAPRLAAAKKAKAAK